MIKEKIKELVDLLRVCKYVLTNHSVSSSLKINTNKQNKNRDKAIVLCNGPSLKDNLLSLREEDDYIVVNYFGLDENFLRLKPKYYCLADGMFFLPDDGNKYKKKIDSLRDLFNNPQIVNWPLTIFVPVQNKSLFNNRFRLSNPNVTIIGVNTIDLNSEKFRHYFYRKAWACPAPQTVANLAIYVLINLGYKKIELYGVDHTFMEGLCVDDNNVVCHIDRHFYSDKVKLVPLEDCFGVRRTLSSELSAYVKIFSSHEKLNAYAKSVGCIIINKTQGSMIDAYQKG